MNTLIPPVKLPEFQSAIDRLVEDISPAAILCFGHVTNVASYVSCFQTTSSEHYHYDLLIVRADTDHRKDSEVLQTVKHRFNGDMSVNVLSHSETSVVSALKERHPFFSKVFLEGTLLYKSEGRQFEVEDDMTIDAPHDHIHSREYERAFELSENFLEIASDAMGSNNHDVGVFLLHQAMEQMCIASIKAHLKYRPTTHSTLKLIDLVNCYLPQAKELFPCNTKDEKELFDFLRNAYTDVRYKTTYRVPPNIAFSLLERVSEFRNLLVARFQQDSECVEKEELQDPLIGH